MQNRLLIVGILAGILFYNVETQELPITCTAGYYRPGETATITCHYHGGITTDRNSGAYIQRHKLDARDSSSGMEVTVCHFSGGSVSVCDPEAGYRFVSFTPSNLTIDVPHVSAEFQGRYTCGLVPPPGESPSRPVKPCLLVVEDISQPEQNNDGQKGSGVHEAVHGHVQAILALLIIVIIAAVALIVYTALAYNKTWFPFRKRDKAEKKDAEKGEKLNSDDTRPNVQKTTNPTFNSLAIEPLQPPVKPEEQPLLKGDNDNASGSAIEDEVAAKRGRAVEIKTETEDERRDRENKERAQRAEDDIRQEEDNLNELKRRLGSADKNEKKSIQKEIDKSEKRLKKLRAEEQLLKKNPGKYEKERKKRKEKEQKEREKAEKGKK